MNQEAVDYAYTLFEKLSPHYQLALLSTVMQIPFPIGLRFKAVYKKITTINDGQKIAIIEAISDYRTTDAEAIDYARELFGTLQQRTLREVLRSGIWKIDKKLEAFCTKNPRKTIIEAHFLDLLTASFIKDFYMKLPLAAQKNLLATTLSTFISYHYSGTDVAAIAQELLDLGSDVNGKDETTGATPLCAAAGLHGDQKGRGTIIQLLVKRGADVNQITAIDTKELLGFVGSGNEQKLTLETPLTIAVKALLWDKNNTLLLTALLKHRADPNLKIVDNGVIVMPLFLAINKGEVDAVEELLKYGSDPAITDQNGNNALAILQQAQKKEYKPGFAEILKLLTPSINAAKPSSEKREDL